MAAICPIVFHFLVAFDLVILLDLNMTQFWRVIFVYVQRKRLRDFVLKIVRLLRAFLLQTQLEVTRDFVNKNVQG